MKRLYLLCVGYDSRALGDEHAVVYIVGHVEVRNGCEADKGELIPVYTL